MRWPWQGRRIPLSWLLLSRQPVRLLVALAGISFAEPDVHAARIPRWIV